MSDTVKSQWIRTGFRNSLSIGSSDALGMTFLLHSLRAAAVKASSPISLKQSVSRAQRFALSTLINVCEAGQMWTQRRVIPEKACLNVVCFMLNTPGLYREMAVERRRRCWGRWDSGLAMKAPKGRLESEFFLMPAINTDPLVFLTSDAMCETKSQPSRAEQLWKPALHVSYW